MLSSSSLSFFLNQEDTELNKDFVVIQAAPVRGGGEELGGGGGVLPLFFIS
jgi:hypothetical protein